MKRIKFFILLALLSSTFFLKGCDQHSFTFSCGFIFPYFDLITRDDRTFTLAYNYNILASLIINLIFIAGCVVFILKVNLSKWGKKLFKAFIALLINIIIFDISVFYYYSKLIKWIFSYYIFWPVMHIANFLGRLEIGPIGLSTLSRIYFLIVSAVLYLLISLVWRVKKKEPQSSGVAQR